MERTEGSIDEDVCSMEHDCDDCSLSGLVIVAISMISISEPKN